jgi:hypothetical protein
MNGSNAMELDDMKAAWQTLNQRLDAQSALNLRVFTDSNLDRMRRGLRPLVWGQAIQIFFGALLALWGGAFWVDHRDVTHLLIAGLIVHATGISMIVSGALMEALMARIDYSAPVLTIQRQLAQLRKVYIRSAWFVVGLPWFVLWVPFTMVALKSVFGPDLYLNAPEMVWDNLGFGIACIFGTLALVRWARGRPNVAPRLGNFAAGPSIVRAQGLLDEIAQFEKE